MQIDIQVEQDGTLDFVAPGRGVIATLSRRQLAILHGLAEPGSAPP